MAKHTDISWLEDEYRSHSCTRWVHALGAACLMVCTSTAAAAGALQLRYWDYRLEGHTTNRERLDFQRDLSARTGDRLDLSLWWRGGPSWLPELGYQRGPLDVRGQQSRTDGLSLLGIPLLQLTTEALIDADLDNQSLTLRYPLRIGDRQHLRAGLTFRWLDGAVDIRTVDDPATEREAINERFPQLHLAWDWQPAPELRLELMAEWIEVSARSGERLEATAEWRPGVGPVSVSAGWAVQRYRFTAGDDRVDARFSGPSASIGLHW